MNNAASEAAVRLRTEWRATEWKSVGRFRGSRNIEVECKDERGRPCLKAVRFVEFRVRKGEAVYVFTHEFHSLMPGDGWRAVELHGLHLDIRSWQELPADVAAQYQRARIRVRALLRVNAAAVAALAWSRPRKATKEAA